MGEVIHVQVGGCGNQIGYQFYERIAKYEHSILPNGEKSLTRNHENIYTDIDEENYYTNVFFEESKSGRWSPRAVLADLEPYSIDQIQQLEYGRMFKSEYNAIYQYGAGGNWAKGHYTIGAECVDNVMEVVRKQAENCGNLQGFQLMHSLGGGSGSGWGTLVISKLREEYPDKIVSSCSVFPSLKASSTNPVEAYNCVLAFHQLIENTDFVSCFDNEALIEIQSKLNLTNEGFSEINRIIAKVMSDVTCSFRFPSHLGYNLRKLATNLIPFPRLHFATISHTPIISDSNNSSKNISELFQNLTSPNNVMCGCDPRSGRYMAAIALFRGSMTLKEVNDVASSVSNKNSNWVDWMPPNLKSNVCKMKSGDFESATLIANSTSIRFLLTNIENRFDNLFKRKAYLHNLCYEGMDEMEFSEAQHNLNDIVTEYKCYEDEILDDFDDINLDLSSKDLI